MPETVLTSALNATTITFNGNERILQNDMGNTLIEDSITGNIMSLSKGFIPLGMKEHGGVLYIASYNPETNEGELGTIPSPILHYTFDSEAKTKTLNLQIADLNSSNEETDDTLVDARLKEDLIYIINDHVFHGGDKFIVQFNLSITDPESGINQKAYSRTSYNYTEPEWTATADVYPIISGLTDLEDPNSFKKGWYTIELYAVTNSQKAIKLDEIINVPQEYFSTTSSDPIKSKYWFINSADPVDIDKTRLRNYFRTYPNIPAGRLAIKIKPELPSDFKYIINKTYDREVPSVQISRNRTSGEVQHFVVFPGFTYRADCPIQPDKIEFTCTVDDIPVEIYRNSVPAVGLQHSGDLILYPKEQSNSIKPKESPNFPAWSYYDENNKNTWAAKNGGFLVSNIGNNQVMISKYRPVLTAEGLELPVSNYDSLNSDGLFYIKINDINSKVVLHVKQYVRYRGTNSSSTGKYTLYSEFDMPEFNPAIMSTSGGELHKNFGNLNISFKNQEEAKEWAEQTGTVEEDLINPQTQTVDTFDVELFKNNDSQKCFLYYNENDDNYIKVYDRNAHRYRWRDVIGGLAVDTAVPKNEEAVDENNHIVLSKFKHKLDSYSDLRTWIYPQYSVTLDSNGKASQNSFEFIWTTLLMRGVEYSPDIIQSVATSIRPTVNCKADGNTAQANLLLPIKRENVPTDLSNIQKDIVSQQNALSKVTNLAGLDAAGMKKYCLYLTNLHLANDECGDTYNKGKTINYANPVHDSHGFAGRRCLWYWKEDSGPEFEKKNIEFEAFWKQYNHVDSISENGELHPADKSLSLFNTKHYTEIADGEELAQGLPANRRIKSAGVPSKVHDTFRNLAHDAIDDSVDKKDRELGFVGYFNHEFTTTQGTVDNNGQFFKRPSTLVLGMMNQLIKKCPGYIKPSTDSKQSLLNLSFINFPNSCDYLYKRSDRTIKLINKNTKNNSGKFIKLLNLIGGVVGSTTSMVNGSTIGAFMYQWDSVFRGSNTGSIQPETIYKENSKLYEGPLVGGAGGIDTYSFYESSKSLYNFEPEYPIVDIDINDNIDRYESALNSSIYKGFEFKGEEDFTWDTNLKNVNKKIDIRLDVKDTSEKLVNSYRLNNKLKYTPFSYYQAVNNLRYDQDKDGFKEREAIKKSYENWGRQWLDDQFMAVVSPQLFVDGSQSQLNFNYLSDYQLSTTLDYTGGEKTGLYYFTEGGMSTYVEIPCNVDHDNLLLEDQTDQTEYMDKFISGNSVLRPRDMKVKGYRSSIKRCGVNTFDDTKGYYQITKDDNILLNQSVILENGLYVFNVNYNYPDKKYFRLALTADGGHKYYIPSTETFDRQFVLLYVSTNIRLTNLKLCIELENSSYRDNTPVYIKNLGLFKVDEYSDDNIPEGYKIQNIIDWCKTNKEDKQIFAVPVETDGALNCFYDSILFEPVFCYKEKLSDGSSLGCMDQIYSGFQNLPDHAYQKCMDIYMLKADDYNRGVFQSSLEDGQLSFYPTEHGIDERKAIYKYLERFEQNPEIRKLASN